ncbi:MAG: peptidoglycan/LPS O-acetylase OafA/YrhL [Crocinitomicaceae bacterium]|jgi:peptidoglycan/LPS O-acetylase OafA/YrhL
MNRINGAAGIFCLYAVITKLINCVSYRQSIDRFDNLDQFTNYKIMFDVLWLILFGALLLVWIGAMFKKADKTKKWIAVLTILFALGMNITDNLHTRFYLSEIVVDGEMLE